MFDLSSSLLCINRTLLTLTDVVFRWDGRFETVWDATTIFGSFIIHKLHNGCQARLPCNFAASDSSWGVDAAFFALLLCWLLVIVCKWNCEARQEVCWREARRNLQQASSTWHHWYNWMCACFLAPTPEFGQRATLQLQNGTFQCSDQETAHWN